jgi:hypothetical protein
VRLFRTAAAAGVYRTHIPQLEAAVTVSGHRAEAEAAAAAAAAGGRYSVSKHPADDAAAAAQSPALGTP